jgi:hypothetical protein
MNSAYLIIFTAVLISFASEARVKLSRTVPVKMPDTATAAPLWVKDFDKVLPKEVNKNDDANKVASQIGDKVIQNWLASADVKNSPLIRTANKVESAMKTEMAVGSKRPNDLNHKVSFQVLALQSSTKVEYKGWFNAAWNYDMKGKKSVVEVSEKLGKNKDLTISHTASSKEDVSAMGVRWSW